MNKKWELCNTNAEKIDNICNKFKINKLIATILVNRGIINEKDIKIFLEPTREDFYNPFLLPDMEKAVERIIKAIQKNEKILIYGDYDVDGITSTSVLKKFLSKRGANVSQYIPNRLEEGYGLNIETIKEISQEGYTLMITVDCGISGIEEVEFANDLGIETIITDHHETLETLPAALAVINPKRKDSEYPFNQLAGVGVVFKLIQAIGIKLNLEEKEYLQYLDLVCIGTISDIVPLVDENRVIAKLGLKLVNVTKNLGLKYLLQAAGYKQIDSNTISFGIAPRVNACGRMGHASEALQIFLSEDEQEVKRLTEKLNEYNKIRQDTERKIVEEALSKIEKNKEQLNSAIILGSENWHHGVIGIVASKITEMYFKPSILLCFEEDMAKGSGRSIPGFDLHKALCKCSSCLEKYGGHGMAIGLTLKKEKFDEFKQKFEKIANKSKISEILPIIYIDTEISAQDMTTDIVKQLKQLEPFGEANKMPLFIYKGLKINSIRALTEGKHLKLTLKDDNVIIDAIGFNMGNLVEDYLIGDKIDIVGSLEINSFNGIETVQINLRDLMKSI
ncbi:MAG: single-stranded-DNA-specific exonuclease RecJ [Clostridia bacterium]|jgi:single-stranded-DNA-specific exonuclease|nr:single-stranded-DNA-specific exonuclease RecJ [Clostridia bacterium]